jgi:hypothetical protein
VVIPLGAKAPFFVREGFLSERAASGVPR